MLVFVRVCLPERHYDSRDGPLSRSHDSTVIALPRMYVFVHVDFLQELIKMVLFHFDS